MTTLLGWYQEPLFWLFPVAGVLINLLAFLGWALPMTLIAARDPQKLQPYRVQRRSQDVARWLWPSLQRTFINTGIVLLLVVPIWPLLRLSGIHAGALPAWYTVVWQLLFFIYLDDILFYWLHRSLHRPWLFRHIHSVHHRVRTPCAIAGNYFHWAEYAAITGLVMIGPLLVGAHVFTLWLWIVLRQLEAASGHCGYDWPLEPLRLLPGYEGNAYHDYHHGSFRGNYAGAFGYLDRLFGTRSPGHAEYRARRAKGAMPSQASQGGDG